MNTVEDVLYVSVLAPWVTPPHQPPSHRNPTFMRLPSHGNWGAISEVGPVQLGYLELRGSETRSHLPETLLFQLRTLYSIHWAVYAMCCITLD